MYLIICTVLSLLFLDVPPIILVSSFWPMMPFLLLTILYVIRMIDDQHYYCLNPTITYVNRLKINLD
jgi:hypothetical protein